MKKIFLTAIAFVMLAMLAFSATAAEPGDYGYYDRDFDGTVEITDALDSLKQIVNDDEETSILRVIRTLKIITTGEVVTIPIKTLDYDTNIATLLYSKGGDDYELQMSFSQLGLDKVSSIAFFEEGFATLTVPSPAADFFASYSASSVYAAAVESRYDMNVLEASVGDANSILNGKVSVLPTAPIVHNDIVMFPVRPIIEFLEATHSWDSTTETIVIEAYGTTLEMTVDATIAYVNGEEVDAPPMLIAETVVGAYTFLPLEFVAEVFGATVVWDEETQAITIMQQFYPTVYLNKVSGAAGEEVAVTAYIKHNPGVAGFEFKISHDSSVMSYISGKSENGNFYIASSTTAGANPVKVVAANLSLKNITGDLTVATITFKIADDVADGRYDFTIEGFKAYDSNIIELQVKTENSTLTVTTP